MVSPFWRLITTRKSFSTWKTLSCKNLNLYDNSEPLQSRINTSGIQENNENLHSSSELRGNTMLTLMDNYNNDSILDNNQDEEEQKRTIENRPDIYTNEEFKEETKVNPLTPKFNKFRFAQMRYSAHNCRYFYLTVIYLLNRAEAEIARCILKRLYSFL